MTREEGIKMFDHPTAEILEERIHKLFEHLRKAGEAFDTAMIIGKVNQYYFTGTMQDGVLVLRREGTAAFFVRKSYDRAKMESPLDFIYKMNTYKDMRSVLPEDLGSTYVDTEVVPVALLERIRKYFVLGEIHSIDRILLGLRAVKSEYELTFIRESGKQHRYVLETLVPEILREGMSEIDFAGELYMRMLKLGHHGVSRFSMFQIEMIIGQLGFGDTSIYPTSFDGPGGMLGMSPAVPLLGRRDRYLRKGDIVFADIGYGIMGYHSDKTQVYSFGAPPAPEVLGIHGACLDVMRKAEGMLRPGKLPADIYRECMSGLPECLSKNFMGYGNEGVRFLGHGVGLQIDEFPVIANSRSGPLMENMVIALEPKCGIEGVGTVGCEETYVIKKDGPECLTGGAREIIVLDS